MHTRCSVLLKVSDELVYGLCLVQFSVEIGIEHALKGPLCPVIIGRVAGAHLAVPVEREAYLVQLLAVVVDVLLGGNGRVLSRLDGVLLGRQAVGIVAHGVEHIESLLAFVACIDVACDVSERVAHMQAGAGGVGKHIEHIELGPFRVFRHLVGLLVYPSLLPFLFNFSEIVFHIVG